MAEIEKDKLMIDYMSGDSVVLDDVQDNTNNTRDEKILVGVRESIQSRVSYYGLNERLYEAALTLSKGKCNIMGDRNGMRLTTLIRECEDQGSTLVGELRILKNYITGHKPRHYHLVAVEYLIDDGAREQAHGDALLLDVNKMELIVLECKKVMHHLPRSAGRVQRENKVRLQAFRHARRISSWLTHLCDFDPRMKSLTHYVCKPAVLTDENPSKIIFI